MRALTLISTLAIGAPALAQTPDSLDFQGAAWRIEAEHAQIVEHLGVEALHWRDGVIWLDDLSFDTGEIRFDLALSGQPGHSGVVWRAQGSGDWEKFYFRHHLSGRPDSVQYTPVFDRVTGWQIYSDADAMSAVDHGLARWMSVRVVVADDQADIFMDGALIHHIPDLARAQASGGVGFWQLAPNNVASAYVRNVEVQADRAPQIVGKSALDRQTPAGLISEWRVSAPFAEDELGVVPLAQLRSRNGGSNLTVEPNGIANLARVARRSQGDTVLAETVLTTEREQTVLIKFGYSDRVQVFLNGERLFVGDNGWASRDYRYLGTVTRHVGVPVRLEPGENTLSFAVSETFGGWGLTAEIMEPDGIEVAS